MRKLTVALLFSTLVPLVAPALERTELLPPQAQTHVRISSVTDCWSRIRQSPLGKLWADEQMQVFLGRPDPEIWKQLLYSEASEAEADIYARQLAMTMGEVILGFSTDADTPFLIAAMKGEDFRLSLVMDEQLRELEDSGLEIIRSTFQDVEVIQHIEPGEETTWQTHVGSTFVMSPDKEWVEQCIVRLKKEEVSEPKGTPTVSLHLPIATLIRQLIEEAQDDAGESGSTDMGSVFEVLGLAGVENFSLNIQLKEDELTADGILRATDLNKGLFTIFDFQPAALPSADFIPENLTAIEVGRLNLLRLWQEIPDVLAAIEPGAKSQFDLMLMMLRQQTGIHIEQDLLSNLGLEYLSYTVVDDTAHTSVIALELSNAGAFRKALETLMASPALQPYVNAALDIEDFLDHTIYSVRNVPEEEAVAFGVIGDYLVYGQPDAVRQVIRNQSSEGSSIGRFENSPLVKGLRAHVPSGAFGFAAVDWKKYMTVLVRELQKPRYFSVLQQNWRNRDIPLPAPEPGKLPPPEHIASFFNTAYMYIEKVPEGLHHRIIMKY